MAQAALPFAIPSFDPPPFRAALLKEALSHFSVATGFAATSFDKLLEWEEAQRMDTRTAEGLTRLAEKLTRRKASHYVATLKGALQAIDDACARSDVVAALVTAGPSFGSAQVSSHSLLIAFDESGSSSNVAVPCTCSSVDDAAGGLAPLAPLGPLPDVPLPKLLLAGRRKVARFFITEGWDALQVDASGSRSLLPPTSKLFISLLVAGGLTSSKLEAAAEMPVEKEEEEEETEEGDAGSDLLPSVQISCSLSAPSLARGGHAGSPSPSPSLGFLPVTHAKRGPFVPAPVLRQLKKMHGLSTDDQKRTATATAPLPNGGSGSGSGGGSGGGGLFDWTSFVADLEEVTAKGSSESAAAVVLGGSCETTKVRCAACSLAASLSSAATTSTSESPQSKGAAEEDDGSHAKRRAPGVRAVLKKSTGRGSVLVLRCDGGSSGARYATSTSSSSSSSSSSSCLPLPLTAIIAAGLENEAMLMKADATRGRPLQWIRLSQPLPPFPPGINVSLF